MKNKALDVCGGILPSAGHTGGSEFMRLFFFFFLLCPFSMGGVGCPEGRGRELGLEVWSVGAGALALREPR